MVGQDFCSFLEFKICKAFEYSDNEDVKGFWCDGVLFNQASLYSKKFINDTRKLTLFAFIGKNGQTEYELTLNFGNKALSRLAKNLDIKACVPNPKKYSFFEIDTKQKKIEIQLD